MNWSRVLYWRGYGIFLYNFLNWRKVYISSWDILKLPIYSLLECSDCFVLNLFVIWYILRLFSFFQWSLYELWKLSQSCNILHIKLPGRSRGTISQFVQHWFSHIKLHRLAWCQLWNFMFFSQDSIDIYEQLQRILWQHIQFKKFERS